MCGPWTRSARECSLVLEDPGGPHRAGSGGCGRSGASGCLEGLARASTVNPGPRSRQVEALSLRRVAAAGAPELWEISRTLPDAAELRRVPTKWLSRFAFPKAESPGRRFPVASEGDAGGPYPHTLRRLSRRIATVGGVWGGVEPPPLARRWVRRQCPGSHMMPLSVSNPRQVGVSVH